MELASSHPTGAENFGVAARLHRSTKILPHEEKCLFLMYFWTLNSNTWCGYKITGFNFFPLPCKFGNSERCVVLACALPPIHEYNFKVVQKTVWQ
jgi:hypothetical protein